MSKKAKPSKAKRRRVSALLAGSAAVADLADWTCLMCGKKVKTVMCPACAKQTLYNALGINSKKPPNKQL